MAATLSLRPPQFSEDVAWLPIWLQHCQGGSVKEFDESSNPHIQLVQVLAICENSIERRERSLLSTDERRNNNFLLFLSGEDDTSASSFSSFGQAMGFQLHLSSSGITPSTQNLHKDISRGQILQSNEVLSTEDVENSALQEPGANQFKVDVYATLGKLPHILSNVDTPDLSNPLQVTPKADLPEMNNILIKKAEISSVAKMYHDKVCGNLLPSTSIPEDYGNDNMESDSKRMISETDYELEDAAIDLAVELSIAASEALVIHELTRDTGLETLSAAAVLEISLRVKQARSEEVSISSGEVNDDIDSLTDLDESIMADAFADVGLLIRDPDDELVCDSPVAGHFEEFDDGFPFMEHRAGIKCAVINPAQNTVSSESKLPSETLQDEVQKELCNESSLGWNVSDTPDDPNLEILGCAVSPQAAYKNTDKKLPNEKTVPTVFAWETSFLSESSIIPSDQNSFAQRKDSRCRIASDSSILFEGFCDQAIDGLFSQDINNPTVSPVDPLCSVVPCSISSEKNTYVRQPFHENATEHANEKWFFPGPDVSVEKISANEKVERLLNINSKASVVSALRLSTSLKTYSVRSPNCNALFGGGVVCSNGPCPINLNLKTTPSGRRINSAGSSDERERDETVILPSSFLSKLNHRKTSVSGGLVTETATEKAKGNESANDGDEAQVLAEDSSSSLSCMNLHPLEVSTNVDSDSTDKGGPKCSSALQTIIECQHREQVPDPELHSTSIDPCSAHVPNRKRVRFSEAADQLQDVKKLQNQRAKNNNRSILRASKRLKPSNLSLDSITQEVKRRLTHCISKDDNNRLVFRGIEFLLTGLSSQKEKDIEGLVRKYGGIVLLGIPSLPPSSKRKRSKKPNDPQIPVILCSKKLQTAKFLYGCAVNAYILKTNWLMDSIAAGSVLPPEKYMIVSNRNNGKCTEIQTQYRCISHDHIFERVGIMLLGKHSFCTKLAEVFKHGGGYVFKTLHSLVQRLDVGKISIGAIIVEDKARVSRHLRHCALEVKIPIMTASWMINSLHLGRLLPVTDNISPTLSPIKVPEIRISIGFSEEI